MTEPEAFLRTIADDLYDDAPRLVYADWLEEHGDSDRAEFIRVQCELEPMRDQYEIDRAAALHIREKELLGAHWQKWVNPMPARWADWNNGAGLDFRRGFVDTVSMPVRTFLDLGAEVRRLHPTIRRVVLFRVNGYGERLAACPALDGLAELELACWYSDEDAQAIAASAHLGRLQVLELWLGRRGGLKDAELCRIMGASRGWPELRELTLLNLDRENEPTPQPLVTTADEAAGRKVAVYRRGYDTLFPFAANYWYTFPGFLPDGQMAMADEDHTTSPPTLCVITFNEEGEQTDTVLQVPMPADLLAIPVKEWNNHNDKGRMKQQLIDVLGFRPGFIRIRDCRFPGDTNDFNRPCWEEVEALGYPDTDDEASWIEYPNGVGGEASYVIRGGQYVFGWDRYADKRGEVHST